MADITDAESDAAHTHGSALHQTKSRAATVRYDRQHKRIIIGLTSRRTFGFPPRLAG